LVLTMNGDSAMESLLASTSILQGCPYIV